MKHLYSLLFCVLFVFTVKGQPPVLPVLAAPPPLPVAVGTAQVIIVYYQDWYVYYIDSKLTWALSVKSGDWHFHYSGGWSKPVHRHTWKK